MDDSTRISDLESMIEAAGRLERHAESIVIECQEIAHEARRMMGDEIDPDRYLESPTRSRIAAIRDELDHLANGDFIRIRDTLRDFTHIRR
ncbi:hypothetical protein QM806_04280 [Rhodococcus sp. IEGM 1351]|uniref:hypothetical protein n=1 Tax=Rhodococcus sp. IEGM 1351 TaxID=3047089 RepID=UPI0024B80409|nr:hypothetical protein [Rhodococcus sp. IEGM 1351]MDI9934671.1 hypothetical protein [Rhodococcus sp. IEGM 1351]